MRVKSEERKTPSAPAVIKDLLHCFNSRHCATKMSCPQPQITCRDYSFQLLLASLSTPASTQKSLLTFMYKYIQFIDDSRAGMVAVGGGCQSSGCGVVQLVEKTSAEKCGWLDVTSPGVAHAHGESGAPVEHKHGRMEIYLQECALLSSDCSGGGGVVVVGVGVCMPTY